jgi:diacylglycerol O-acyltransferase / wax synthase
VLRKNLQWGAAVERFATPEAAVLLKLESAEHPMHIASLQVFVPPANAGEDFPRQIFEALRACTDVAPVFRGHPKVTRRGTSPLRWVHDERVDLDEHLKLVSLPAPGGDRQFFDLLSTLHSSMLDRTRPLWEAYVISGLQGGRFAVYIKSHHALLDGVSGMRLLRNSLSTDPDDGSVRASWTTQESVSTRPAPPTRRPRPKRRALADAAVAARRSASVIRQALRERDLFPALRAPRTMFNAAGGGLRTAAVRTWPLQRVNDVARAAGVSANDVVAAMTAGALRSYLMDRDALPDTPLAGMLPVSIRTADDVDERNILGSAVCNLATHLDDPGERLRLVSDSMTYNKQFIRSLPRQVAIHLAGLICAPVGGGSGITARIPLVFNVAISHVPAPRETLYRKGARLEATYALPPTLTGQALNFGVVSDAHNVAFSLVACAEIVPGAEQLLDHLEVSLKELERAVGV